MYTFKRATTPQVQSQFFMSKSHCHLGTRLQSFIRGWLVTSCTMALREVRLIGMAPIVYIWLTLYNAVHVYYTFHLCFCCTCNFRGCTLCVVYFRMLAMPGDSDMPVCARTYVESLWIWTIHSSIILWHCTGVMWRRWGGLAMPVCNLILLSEHSSKDTIIERGQWIWSPQQEHALKISVHMAS